MKLVDVQKNMIGGMKNIKENKKWIKEVFYWGIKMVKKRIYRKVLKSMLKNAELMGLTGKQRSQIQGLLKKCESK